MVNNTQFFNSYVNNSSLIQLSNDSKNQNSQTISNTLSDYNNIISDNSKQKLNNINKKRFDEVLNFKKDSKVSDKRSIANSSKNFESDKVKDKINDSKEDIKETDEKENSEDKKVNDILDELLNGLNILIKSNELSQMEKVKENNKILETLIEKLTNNNDKNNLLNQLLKVDSNNFFDSDILKQLKSFLQQLSGDSNNDNNMNKGINNIISKLDEVLQNSEEQGKNVAPSQELFKQDTSNENSNSGMLGNNNSKENKFLNSLIEDKNDSIDNKINLFASRTQSIQTQNTEAKGLTINKSTFTSDLIKDVKYMNVNNIKELTVKVNPGNLGEITIRLVQEDGFMKVNLKANSKETAELLSQNLSEIKKELVDQNIKVSEVNIDIYNEDSTFFKEQTFGGQLSQEQNNNERKSNNSGHANVSMDEDDEMQEENLSILDNNLDFLV
ncbi:flagellar hook-length control protein FliK [Clostridium sp. SM-530-WT-3G]|uniref:flagellar hook-length control protein FliK n=1 Tax=Clostridium sp. SM-530-WT-3G TaxID=2725303 RepID=UPI00145ECC2E|nr:flagellar hook-length control protein FliK [Clostridium sp. SM-530-WT-3G]NME82767.1 flagellar hook-length control protein FliK [Clostridium sp. SM-530-WT-3G]